MPAALELLQTGAVLRTLQVSAIQAGLAFPRLRQQPWQSASEARAA
jgi:hypothetical protein